MNLMILFSFQILLKLGIIVYKALDYNQPTGEELCISFELEHVLQIMTQEGMKRSSLFSNMVMVLRTNTLCSNRSRSIIIV